VKLCTLATQAFQSQQSGAVTKMWWWWQVQPSQKECALGAVHCKKEVMLQVFFKKVRCEQLFGNTQ